MKLKLFLLFLLSPFIFAQHQFLQIPKLSDEDVKREKPELQADAPAEVLYRSFHPRIDYDGHMYTEVFSRVKIYKKDQSAKFLDEEIAYYDGPDGREEIQGLKAFTYNYEDGKVVPTKVEKDSKFRSKEDKQYVVTKFAFPNVKDGSVLEYKYTIETPFLMSIPRFMIEDDIPIKYVEYVFDTPVPLGYNINYKGSLIPKYRESVKKNIYGGDYQVYRFAYEGVPAYKDEEHVLNNDNYKTSIKAELNSTMINGIFKSYGMSWEDIRKRLYESENFGDQLKKTNAVKDLLPAEIKSISKNEDKMEAILKFVQKNYKWNEENDVATDKGIKELINSKIGNTADINLLLTLLLKNAGFNANPLVLSTVRHGMLLSYSPTISQLNYVIACIEDAGKIYILDATSKLSEVNMVPPRALNYYGLLMTDKEVKQLNIVNPTKSETFLTVNATLSPDGTFSGNFSDKDTKTFAMLNKELYEGDKDAYQKEYKEQYKFPFTDIKTEILDKSGIQTTFNFSSDTFVDAIGGKLVFNPLLFLFSQNHTYNQTEPRKAPVEFVSGYDKIKKVTITLPEGYVFENVPKSKKFKTDDDSIQYVYYVEQEGNKLTVETTVTIADTTYPAEYYPAFKQIYDNITKLEGQVVTAVKK